MIVSHIENGMQQLIRTDGKSHYRPGDFSWCELCWCFWLDGADTGENVKVGVFFTVSLLQVSSPGCQFGNSQLTSLHSMSR